MVHRKIRLASWGIIVAMGALQAYAHRYAVSPDGISYLDLSDAVVTGRWSDLLNTYWSPLYPFLIGLARLVFGTGARNEVAILHAVNFACFAAMCAGFEYFIIQIFSLSARTRGTVLRGAWGTACTYALFGTVALTLVPLELTTPDLLSSAAVFVALGALLRLHDDTYPRRRQAAVLLGLSLGLGALAKAFLVPWSIVCFVALGVALRRRALAPLGIALGVWAVFVVSWTVALSAHAGRFTFGDAGRLTYAWYVNGQDPPSLRVVPLGARRLETEMLLPDVGITDSAQGTDPMWYDPARWAAIKPQFSIKQQILAIIVVSTTFFSSIWIALYVFYLFAVAPEGSRKPAWRAGWIVFVPCAAGIFGYMMVLLTARYIAAFTLGGMLVTLAVLPIPRRVRPVWLLLGLVVQIGLLAIAPKTAWALSFETAIMAAMLMGSAIPTRRHILWMVMVPLALGFSLAFLTPTLPAMTRLAAAAFALWLFARAFRAIRQHRTVDFALGLHVALALSLALIFGGRLALRLNRDATAAARSDSMWSSNPEWRIAQDLRDHGVEPGTRIALVGPHAESYWARTARLQIVASVPDPITPIWWLIPQTSRDSLFKIFAAHGAQVVIVTRPPADRPMDSTWVRLRYQGWMKPLPLHRRD